VNGAKISLVFIVISKGDRMDGPTKSTWAAVMDLLLGLGPNSIVLTITKCDEGLDA
jgi:hypothetical protein